MNPLLVALPVIALHQLAVMSRTYGYTAINYLAAASVARESGKPLLVVGGPYGSNMNRILGIRAHPCGNVCMDIHVEACHGCPEVVESDIRDMPFQDGFFGASLAAHVLEHMPTADDCVAAIAELRRVSDYAFMVFPPADSLVSWLIPSHHLWVKYINGRRILIRERRQNGKTVTVN